MNKKILRQRLIQKRKNLSEFEIKEKSFLISQKLFHSNIWKNSSIILIYKDFKNEVKTDLIIKKAFQENKKVYIPKIKNQEMEFYEISEISKTSKGKFGIMEPELKNKLSFSSNFSNSKIEILKNNLNILFLIPAVGVDKEGNRVGWGGGFYDKYLENLKEFETLNPKICKCGIVYNFQIVEKVEAQYFDQKLDFIISEEQILKIT